MPPQSNWIVVALETCTRLKRRHHTGLLSTRCLPSVAAGMTRSSGDMKNTGESSGGFKLKWRDGEKTKHFLTSGCITKLWKIQRENRPRIMRNAPKHFLTTEPLCLLQKLYFPSRIQPTLVFCSLCPKEVVGNACHSCDQLTSWERGGRNRTVHFLQFSTYPYFSQSFKWLERGHYVCTHQWSSQSMATSDWGNWGIWNCEVAEPREVYEHANHRVEGKIPHTLLLSCHCGHDCPSSQYKQHNSIMTSIFLSPIARF